MAVGSFGNLGRGFPSKMGTRGWVFAKVVGPFQDKLGAGRAGRFVDTKLDVGSSLDRSTTLPN